MKRQKDFPIRIFGCDDTKTRERLKKMAEEEDRRRRWSRLRQWLYRLFSR